MTDRPDSKLQEGAFASLLQGDVRDTITETDVRAVSGNARVELDALLDAGEFGARYEVASLLGKGGMGEVRLCRDVRIGREIALKQALPKARDSDEARARFLREARIQGQLEHPAIVPVHDLEVLADGSTYFTMKRVRGQTLSRVLTSLRDGTDEAAVRFTRRRLLQAFNTVCLAIDFAHSRGVVHRDLKPENIMLGDFGEVYVLDWGLAKMLEGDDERPPSEEIPLSSDSLHTLDDTVLGTLGYMAPEQLRRDLAPISPRTDVFALGSLLFELLTLHPVIESGTRIEMMMATLGGVDARASERFPEAEVPAELEAICVKALSHRPEDRFPSARKLHDAVERFLEGDENRERRRVMSQQYVRAAENALEGAISGGGPEDLRGRAMHDLTRALALDPDNRDATRTLVKLLTHPPDVSPPEVEERLRGDHRGFVKLGARMQTYLIAAWLPFIPITLWMGLLDARPFVLALVPLVAVLVISFVVSRQPQPSRALQASTFVLQTICYMALTRGFGPFTLVPALFATYAVTLQSHPDGFMRKLGLGAALTGLTIPTVLEAAGVLAPSFTFVEGGMLLHEGMFQHHPTFSVVLLLCGSLAITAFPALYVQQLRVTLTAAERRLHLQAWHLERLLPKEATRDGRRRKKQRRSGGDRAAG